MPEVAPNFRDLPGVTLVGDMVIYGSHAELVERVPEQWQRFLRRNARLARARSFFGASPCSDDGKIHYFTGVSSEELEDLEVNVWR